MKFLSLLSYKVLIFVTIIGIGAVVMGAREMIWLSHKAIDLNDPDVEWSDLKEGDHIKMEINYLFEPYCKTEDKSGNIKWIQYAMPKIGEKPENPDYLTVNDVIGVNVNDKNLYSEYSDLSDATVDWWTDDDAKEINAEPIKIEGIVRKLNTENKDYFEEYLKDIGYSSEFISSTAYEYGIYPAQKSNVLICVIGIVAFLFGAGLMVLKIVKKS